MYKKVVGFSVALLLAHICNAENIEQSSMIQLEPSAEQLEKKFRDSDNTFLLLEDIKRTNKNDKAQYLNGHLTQKSIETQSEPSLHGQSIVSMYWH